MQVCPVAGNAGLFYTDHFVDVSKMVSTEVDMEE